MTSNGEGALTAEVFPELTRDIIDRTRNAKSARLREVMEIVIRHLHAIGREVKPRQSEWCKTVEFLTRARKMCSDSGLDLIRLSDILGVSMLVDAVDNAAGPGTSDPRCSARSMPVTSVGLGKATASCFGRMQARSWT